jgi:RND superfamily putative drug exporter
VLSVWLVAAIAIISLQGSVGGEFNDDFRVPGVESQEAADILTDRFPSQSGATARIVLHTSEGRLDDDAHRTSIGQSRQQLLSGADVVDITDPFAPEAAALSADGQTAYVDITYSVTTIETTHLADAKSAAATTRAAGVQTEFTGNLAYAEAEEPGSEMIGLAVAVIVLLVAFGSVIAMGLPIITALIGILIGSAGVGVLAAFGDVPEISNMIGMMIGLGVGIDYALFIVTRHRQQLHEGMSVADSAGTANATAGQAVLFAGTTVVIAILGLFLAGLPAITMLGVSVAIVVVVSMIAAVTLLPGLLGLAGTKIDKLSIHRKRHVAKPAHATFSGRWAHHVGSHPVRYALVSLLALGALAVPALSMRIGMADDGNAGEGRTEREAYDLLGDGFGKGFNGPIQVVVDIPTPADQLAVPRIQEALQGDPGIAAVTPPMFNESGDTALLTVNPTTAPQHEQTDALVRHLRSDVLPATVEGTNARALLTGQAMVTDMTARITTRLPIFIAAVVALSFLLLMIVFRSVLVPLKAALMNLLSIGAAYGVVVAIFQWGWAKDLIGLEQTVPINPFAPLMMFAILFGLSMDYEVFLLSRVREQYVDTGDSHTSVVDGLSSTARVITSAALIMISVFGAFILGDDPIVKMFGVGLSVAVFLDAALVRMVLVPATMSLLGGANWWLPKWLDRILPHLDLEGGKTDVDVIGIEPERELIAA